MQLIAYLVISGKGVSGGQKGGSALKSPTRFTVQTVPELELLSYKLEETGMWYDVVNAPVTK